MSEVQEPISIGQVEEAGANLLKTDLSTSLKELRTEWRSGRNRGCLISHASICYRSLDKPYPSDENADELRECLPVVRRHSEVCFQIATLNLMPSLGAFTNS